MEKKTIIISLIVILAIVIICALLFFIVIQGNQEENEVSKFIGTWDVEPPSENEGVAWNVFSYTFYNNGSSVLYQNWTYEGNITDHIEWFTYNFENDKICTEPKEEMHGSRHCYYYVFSNNGNTITFTEVGNGITTVLTKKR